jgi:hypothetical protein
VLREIGLEIGEPIRGPSLIEALRDLEGGEGPLDAELPEDVSEVGRAPG